MQTIGPSLESPEDDQTFFRSVSLDAVGGAAVEASTTSRICQNFSDMIGNSLISTSNGARASHSAFVKAPGTGPGIPSPIPREPRGVCGHGVNECVTST